MTRDVQTVRPDEVRALEPELSGLRIHHRHERRTVAVADVVRKRHCGVVGTLDQCGLDEITHAYPFTGAEMDGRLADCGSVRPDSHHVLPTYMVERDENRHQFRDARDRDARPSPVLGKHLARGGVLDDERSRQNGRRRCDRCPSSDEGERRKDCGDPDPEDHESQDSYLTRMRCPMCIAVGSIPGFRVISSSTVVLYFSAMEPSVSPLSTT